MKRIGSSRPPQNRSTCCCIQRAFSATPSSTLRTSCARVVSSDRFSQPPRVSASSTGVRSPFSQGQKSDAAAAGRRLRGERGQRVVPALASGVPASQASRSIASDAPAVCCSHETR